MSCRIALAAVLATAVASAHSHAASWTELPLHFVVLQPGASIADVQAFVSRLEAEGGHASVVTPPHSALVYADRQILDRPAVARYVSEAHVGDLDAQARAALRPEARRAAEIWSLVREMRATGFHSHPSGALGGAPGPRPPDAGPRPAWVTQAPVPPRRSAVSDNMPLGAEYYDTSAYMAGSTAIGVWLLEAAGSQYDWTTAEENQTLAGVVAGMDNWVVKAGPGAFLTFFMENHTGVPVSGIPIENPQSTETVWIDEALGNAGWTQSGAFEKCFAYNNSIRDTFDTNWCASIFIVDSDPGVNQGLFSGGGYAWAYYGGPWVYMSRYSTWAYNAPNYWAVVPMHEMGHIFMDTDEYDGVLQIQGYLNEPDNPSVAVVCIMNQNDSTLVCPQTRNQLGWRDLNLNLVYDAMDADPVLTVDEHLPDPTGDTTPTWTGSAGVQTAPNLNPQAPYTPPHDMTVATISLVEARVDLDAFTPATPTDGAFDDYVESFSWTAPPLADGVHAVEVRVTTTAGNTASATDTLTVDQALPAPEAAGSFRLALEPSAPSPIRSSGVLRFSVPGQGAVRLSLFTVQGERVRTLVDSQVPAGARSVRWDGSDGNGRRLPAGVYFARLETAFGTLTRKVALLR